MIHEMVSLNEVIKFLNECLALDRVGITALVDTRVNCNKILARHC